MGKIKWAKKMGQKSPKMHLLCTKTSNDLLKKNTFHTQSIYKKKYNFGQKVFWERQNKNYSFWHVTQPTHFPTSYPPYMVH